MKASSLAGLIRVWTLPMTVSLILLGASYASFLGLKINYATLLPAIFGSLLLHAGANVLNDVNDVIKGIDSPRSPTAAYREHPVLHGEIGKRSAVMLSYLLVASGLLTGAVITFLTGPAVFLLELAGALALFSYNGPILDLKAKGFGEFLVSTVWGPLFVMGGFSASAAGRLSFYAFLISIQSALIMMAVIYSNNYRDIETDIAAGVRSFAYRTRSRSNFIYTACIFGAYALQLLYIIFGILPLSTLVSFFTIPYAASLPKKFSKKAVDIDAKTGLLFTAYKFLIVAGLII